jgi:hypothetical protein
MPDLIRRYLLKKGLLSKTFLLWLITKEKSLLHHYLVRYIHFIGFTDNFQQIASAYGSGGELDFFYLPAAIYIHLTGGNQSSGQIQ